MLYYDDRQLTFVCTPWASQDRSPGQHPVPLSHIVPRVQLFRGHVWIGHGPVQPAVTVEYYIRHNGVIYVICYDIVIRYTCTHIQYSIGKGNMTQYQDNKAIIYIIAGQTYYICIYISAAPSDTDYRERRSNRYIY